MKPNTPERENDFFSLIYTFSKQIDFKKAGGIGRNIAKEFLKFGCTLDLVDINNEELNKLEHEFSSQSANNGASQENRMFFYNFDITST